MKNIKTLTEEAIVLLKKLIETPSFSSEEDQTALLIEKWFVQNDIKFHRENNNIWAFNKNFDENKPTLLLNSHHDTARALQLGDGAAHHRLGMRLRNRPRVGDRAHGAAQYERHDNGRLIGARRPALRWSWFRPTAAVS